jgi:hypothetical protein
MRFQGGDTVVRRGRPSGDRGMVLGYDEYGGVLVCWQYGYLDYMAEDETALDAVEVLDLMVEAFDGKETKWKYGPGPR